MSQKTFDCESFQIVPTFPCGLHKLPDKLTTWGGILPEKLTYPQLVKKFPEFYGTQTFITTHKSL